MCRVRQNMSLFHGGSVAYTKAGIIIEHPNWLVVKHYLSIQTTPLTILQRMLKGLPTIETYTLPCLLASVLVMSTVNTVRTAFKAQRGRRHLETHLCAFCIGTWLTIATGIILYLPRYLCLGRLFPPVIPYLASLQHWFWMTTIWLFVACLSNRAINSQPPNAHQIASTASLSWRRFAQRTPSSSMCSAAIFLVSMTICAPRLWQYQPVIPQKSNMVNASLSTWLQLGPDPPPEVIEWLYHTTGLILPTLLILILCVILCMHSRRWYTLVKIEFSKLDMNSPSTENNASLSIDPSVQQSIEAHRANVLIELGSANLPTNHFCLLLTIAVLPMCTPLPLLHMSATASGNGSIKDLHRSAIFMAMHTGLTLLFYMGLLLAQLCILIGFTSKHTIPPRPNRLTLSPTISGEAKQGCHLLSWWKPSGENGGVIRQPGHRSCLPLQQSSIFNRSSIISYE